MRRCERATTRYEPNPPRLQGCGSCRKRHASERPFFVTHTGTQSCIEQEERDSTLCARITDLAVTFQRNGAAIRALRGVTLDIHAGEVLAMVGESGSGKSVTGLALLGVLDAEPHARITGDAQVRGIDMVRASAEIKKEVRRRHLGAVFQDPLASLNPTMRIGRQVTEAAGSRSEAIRMLDLVGLPDAARRMQVYPHELSGGLRQRVMIAMAIAGRPDLVIADEPTTALDVTVQAQVLALIRNVCDELRTSFLFVTHDIGVASQIADRIAVMYAGRVVEIGKADHILRTPTHPYTQGLLDARLRLDLARSHQIPTLPGRPPDPRTNILGCSFAPRCPARVEQCDTTVPPMAAAATHTGRAACEVPDAAQTATLSQHTAAFTDTVDVDQSTPALHVNSVSKHFDFRQGFIGRKKLSALRNIVLEVQAGEALAVVGESGSGKSTLLRILSGVTKPSSGDVDCVDPHPQMIFQDAGASLTPWLTVGEIVGERLLKTTSRRQRTARVAEVLQRVGLPTEVAEVRAGFLSGGQRQRVAIARAIVVPPAVLLCDEPTSALDASLAASVLNLLQELRHTLGMAMLFVTHDLAAARFISDRTAVVYLGQVVEIGPTQEIIDDPKHPYTKALLAAIPQPGAQPLQLSGEPASPLAIPTGCPFHPRCAERIETCSTDIPHLQSLGVGAQRLAACVHVNPA